MRNEEIKKGSRWQHFKGWIVEFVCVAKNSETLEEMVVYHHDGEEEIWVRPKIIFFSSEDVSGRSDNVTGQKYRFEKCEKIDLL